MRYGTVPGIDKSISRIVLGTMIVSDGEPSPPGTEFPYLGLEGSFELLDAVVERGGNAFDSAHVYGIDGSSEKGLGLWMEAHGNRDDMFILTKGGVHKGEPRVTPAFIREDMDLSLDRLRTSYIDLYIVHHDDPGVPVEPIVDLLNKDISDGRIRAYGFSNWSVDRIKAAWAYARDAGMIPPAANQPHYSLAEQVENPWGPGNTSLGGPSKVRDREWHIETGLAVFSYSSLSRGFLSGRVDRESYLRNPGIVDGACRKAYCHEVNFRRLDRAIELAARKGVSVPQVALAFLFSSGLDMFPIVGAASGGEYRDLAESLSIELASDERSWLDLETD